MATACIKRNGEIIIGEKSVRGALVLATGVARRTLVEVVSGTARLGYDNRIWLVPGIPEAETDAQAEVAAIAYRDRFKRSLQSTFEKRRRA